jgi:hypothetical protein
MNREREVNRRFVEQRPPEPDEARSYTEATTVTEETYPRLPGPPQESGTMTPHD